MSLYNAIDTANTGTDRDERKLTISVGRVVDTNDPMQMGRVRVYIAGLDGNNITVRDIPFAIYCSPFAGHQQVQSRGPEDGVYTTGPVAYGMFAIPKVGTDVLVAHLNGDPTYRIWFGALYGLLLSGTLPHGRYMFNNPNAAEAGDLDGPLSASEQPIQPLYQNQTSAYTRTTAIASNDGAIDTTPRKNFEWRVRGADFQGAALGNLQRNLPDQKVSKVTDDRNFVFTEEDGKKFHNGNFTQGYAQSRIQPNATYDPGLVDGGQNLDPQTYSWTTPGFSSIAMDDRPENARIRLRTGTGHQIILDDTNERIYISTVEGNNWIEMDQSGNVDIYAARRVSIHAAMDVNITTEQTFRVYAAQGIHMTSGGEVRITAANDMHLKTDGGDMQVYAANNINVQSGYDISVNSSGTLNLMSGYDTNVKSGGYLNLQSTSDTNINSGAELNLQSKSDTNIKSSADVNIESSTDMNISSGAALNLQSTTDTNINTMGTGAWSATTTLNLSGTAAVIIGGGAVDINGATPAPAGPAGTAGIAGVAGSATFANAFDAYFTNRVPEHEPWGRIMMDQNSTDNDLYNTFTLQLNYDSPEVGRLELNETIKRNPRWHR
jgi:uncharacterized protein (DUF2345 family)